MTLPVAPELFDLLIQYAEDMEAGKFKPAPSLGATSPALAFRELFYAQFFQNRLHKEIKQFNLAAKKEAIRLRLQIKDQQGPSALARNPAERRFLGRRVTAKAASDK